TRAPSICRRAARSLSPAGSSTTSRKQKTETRGASTASSAASASAGARRAATAPTEITTARPAGYIDGRPGRARAPGLADTPLLRRDQAGELLAVKPSWIYGAVRAGRLPCLRVGRHILFTRAML